MTGRGPDQMVPAGQWTDEFLDILDGCGDPEADDAVKAYLDQAGMEAHRMVGALAATAALPPEEKTPQVAAFLNEHPPLPDWADWDALDRTAALFETIGPQMCWAMIAASGPAGYLGYRGARVLAFTGRLHDDVRRRVMEAAQLLIHALGKEKGRGGLYPGQPGYLDARRVRLMHAGVRHLIRTDPRVTAPEGGPPLWPSDWGVPINQEELVGYLMPMTLTAFRALDVMDLHLTDDQQADYLHTWCVIGSLMGVRDDLVPMGLESAGALWERVQQRQYGPSVEGRALTAALIDWLDSFVPGDGVPAGFMRRVLGDAHCDALGVPPGHWNDDLVMGAMSELTRLGWKADGSSHAASGVFALLGKVGLDGFLAYQRSPDRPAFNIPTELAATWWTGSDGRPPS